MLGLLVCGYPKASALAQATKASHINQVREFFLSEHGGARASPPISHLNFTERYYASWKTYDHSASYSAATPMQSYPESRQGLCGNCPGADL